MGAIGYLLDTHTFLWAAHDETKLSDTVEKTIKDKNSKICISAVSAFEIMNKYRLGKLPKYAYLAENYFEVLSEFGADEILISSRHTHFAGKFDWSHRDPFDRLLAAQAYTEDLILITNDLAFDSLPWLNILW